MHLTHNIFGIHHPLHKATLLLTHFSLIAMAFTIASKLRLATLPNYLSTEFLGIAIITIVSMFFGGVFTSTGIGRRPKLPLRTFFVVLVSAVPSMIFIYLLGPEKFTAILGRGVYPIGIASFAAMAVTNQYLWNRVFYHPSAARCTIVIGPTQYAQKVEDALTSRDSGLRVTGLQSFDASEIERQEISSIVLCPEYKPSPEEQRHLLDLRLKGLPIYSFSDFFESFFFLVPVNEIDNEWFIRAEGFLMLGSSTSLRIKRFIDIIAALILMIISIPVILIAALMILASSRGTVFFRQTRVGLNGQEFLLYKLRTMHMNAEIDGAKWAQDNDKRAFPVGRILRKSRIDELPQWWNILKGEMSLIGPRPERPEFTAKLSEEIPYYDLRHVVKPGLSGWAQVSYPYGSSIEDSLKKLQFDLYYIKNYTLLLDLNILLRTVLVMFSRSGR